MKVRVVPGARYTIGVPRPMLVTNGMIVSSAEDSGFRNVSIASRPTAHLSFDPRALPGYDDDWDTVIRAEYRGTDPLIEAPGTPSWMYEELPARAPTPTPAPVTPSSSPAPTGPSAPPAAAASDEASLWVWVVAGVVAGAFGMWSWRKS